MHKFSGNFPEIFFPENFCAKSKFPEGNTKFVGVIFGNSKNVEKKGYLRLELAKKHTFFKFSDFDKFAQICTNFVRGKFGENIDFYVVFAFLVNFCQKISGKFPENRKFPKNLNNSPNDMREKKICAGHKKLVNSLYGTLGGGGVECFSAKNSDLTF